MKCQSLLTWRWHLSAAAFTATMWLFFLNTQKIAVPSDPTCIYQKDTETWICFTLLAASSSDQVMLGCRKSLIVQDLVVAGVEDVKAEKFCAPPRKECQWWKCGFIVPNYFWFSSSHYYNFFLGLEPCCLEGKGHSCCRHVDLVVSVITWLHA